LKHIAPFLPALGLLFAYFPLIQAGRKEVSHFWSPATASSLFDGYAALFPDGTGLTVVFILLMLTLSSYLSRSSGAMPNAGSRAYDATDEGDLVVLIALILAPACCVLLGVFVTGGYVPRYTIYTVLGVIIITILVGAQLRNPLAPLAVFLVLTASFVRTGIIAPITSFQKGIGDPARIVVEELNRLNGADLVIPRGTDFFRYWHYAPATHRNRIVYLTDSAAAAGYTGANTADRTLQLFKPVAGFPVQVYADYVATHQVVYVLGSHDWILRKLKDSGAKIEILRWTGEDPLFRVDLPG